MKEEGRGSTMETQREQHQHQQEQEQEHSPRQNQNQNQNQDPYQQPNWAWAPNDARNWDVDAQDRDITLEIFKGGVQLNEVVSLMDRIRGLRMNDDNDGGDDIKNHTRTTFVVCGRAPFPFVRQELHRQESKGGKECDHLYNNFILMEHPSISRNHCVIQLGRGKNGLVQLYLYDLGSTHGTFLNRRKLNPHEYYKINDGDLVVFGDSTRMYLLHNKYLHREEQAQHKMHEIDVDIGADEPEEQEEGVPIEDELLRCMPYDDNDNFDWRNYKGQITEKQERLMSKIRERDYKINNMLKEIENIQAKKYNNNSSRRFDDDVGDGLTDGQRNQIMRNNNQIDKLQDEIDGLVCNLEESIKDSILGRSKFKKDGGEKHRRKRPSGRNDEDSEDDDFYDRTITRKTNKVQNGHKNEHDTSSGVVDNDVETVESLWIKREECENIIKELEEEKRRALKGKLAQGNPVQDTEGTHFQHYETDDLLEAYMTDISKKVHETNLISIEKQLEEQSHNHKRLCRLINLADPEGLYNHERCARNTSSALGLNKKQLPIMEPKSVSVAKRMAEFAQQKEMKYK